MVASGGLSPGESRVRGSPGPRAVPAVISRGAEGDLFESVWNQKRCVVKERKAKAYRNEILDYRIRRSRTVRESEMLRLVKRLGVRAPLVYFVDAARCRLYLQYLDGPTVQSLPGEGLVRACGGIGRIAAVLHRNSIMHGDLTTSNFIAGSDGILSIDFGLSQRTAKPEDHATDLRVFKEILGSAHAESLDAAWGSFLGGYEGESGPAAFSRMLKLLSVIESRGRYATVV